MSSRRGSDESEHTSYHLGQPQFALPILGNLRLLRVATHYLKSGEIPGIDAPVVE